MITLEPKKPTISILGCGWYGLELAKKLVLDGYQVKGSTTSEEKLSILKEAGIQPFIVNFELENIVFERHFFESELLIISIPPKRSSPSLLDYPAKIKAIATAARNSIVKQIIFISSTGVYADGNAVVNENLVPTPESDSGKMMYRAEELLKEERFTTTIIRFAGLIGPNRNLAKHFAGKTAIGNGLAPINLIHLVDCVQLTQTIIELKAFGKIYHGVTPDHPSRADFYTKNCVVNGFEKPQFIQELTSWKQIESVNVPKFLNYRYQIKNWDDWLQKIS